MDAGYVVAIVVGSVVLCTWCCLKMRCNRIHNKLVAADNAKDLIDRQARARADREATARYVAADNAERGVTTQNVIPQYVTVVF
jgi:hypothetical protein